MTDTDDLPDDWKNPSPPFLTLAEFAKQMPVNHDEIVRSMIADLQLTNDILGPSTLRGRLIGRLSLWRTRMTDAWAVLVGNKDADWR